MQDADVHTETPLQEPAPPEPVGSPIQVAAAETPVPEPTPKVEEASAPTSQAVGTKVMEKPAAEAEGTVQSPPAGDGLAALQAELAAVKQTLAELPTAESLRGVQSTIEELRERVAASETVEEPPPAAASEVADLRQQLSSLQSNLTELGTAVHQAAAPGVVDVGSAPPEVLQSAYEASLTALYAEMVKTLGPGALQSTQLVMEGVRRSSSGTEFFSLEDNRFVAKGVAGAIKRRQLSPYQVQETFTELFRRLAALVPSYQPQPLSELINSGTSAFVVSTLTRVLGQIEEHLAGVESVSTAHSTISEQLAQLERRIVEVAESAEVRQQAAEERLAALEARGSVGQGGAQRKQAKRSSEGGDDTRHVEHRERKKQEKERQVQGGTTC